MPFECFRLGRLFHQRLRKRLAANARDVDSHRLEHLHGMRARRLPMNRPHTRGSHRHVRPPLHRLAQKPLGHRASANVSGADKEDVFHSGVEKGANIRSRFRQVNERACQVLAQPDLPSLWLDRITGFAGLKDSPPLCEKRSANRPRNPVHPGNLDNPVQKKTTRSGLRFTAGLLPSSHPPGRSPCCSGSIGTRKSALPDRASRLRKLEGFKTTARSPFSRACSSA